MSDTANDNRQQTGSRLFFFLVKLSALLVFLAIFLTFLQVTLRYFFNTPLAWIEEASRYLFVWIVMLGAAIAFRLDAHIRVDLIDNLLGTGSARLIAMVRNLLSLLATGLILYSGLLVAWRNRSAAAFTVPDFPAVVFYASVPVGAALMGVFIVRTLLRSRH